ncbi:MAG: hypothetical protein ABRQ38_27315 [Candidatus Eremiobacterota bacterium]
MKAYELPAQITSDGKIDIPDRLLTLLPKKDMIRVIILVEEPSDIEENSLWPRFTSEQFFSGYSDSDSIYDRG